MIQGNHNIVYIMMEGILGPAAKYSEIKLGVNVADFILLSVSMTSYKLY